MKRVLSFGAGVQTTALAILVAQGKVKVDEVIFADTACEKPETYWYIDNLITPHFKSLGIPFNIVRNEQPNYRGGLYDFLWRRKALPGIIQRRCTDHFKIRPINRSLGKEDVIMIIGFSLDEAYRAQRSRHKYPKFPLIDMGMTANDCRYLIQSYGWTMPLKSSCYFCQFQRPQEWNWLKNNHPDLFQKAIDLEENYHQRKPEMRNQFGLLGGTPLWKLKNGLQPEMFKLEEDSCWSGHCGH